MIANAYKKIAEVMKDVDLTSGQTPDPDTLAKLQKVQGEIDQAELTKANTNITAWVKKNCPAAAAE